jgi:hypothetical protein
MEAMPVDGPQINGARLVPQPGQCTSSHGMPAINAARIVGA